MRIALFLLGFLIAGCAPLPPLASVDMTWLSLQAARTAQEGMLDPAVQHPDRLYNARIRIGSEYYSISTAAPLVLSSYGRGDMRAVSAVRFSKDQLELVFFTRNPKNGEAFRTLIPLNEATYWPVFSFPFIKGQNLEMLPVQVVDLRRQPDRSDNVRGIREYLQRSLPESEPQFMEIGKERPSVLKNDQ